MNHEHGSMMRDTLVFIKIMTERTTTCLSNSTMLQKPFWHVHRLRPQVLTAVLAQGVISRARVVSSIKMIMQEEVDRANIRHLEVIDPYFWLAELMNLFWAQQFLDLVHRQDGAQPIPLLVVGRRSYEEVDIAVESFVAGST